MKKLLLSILTLVYLASTTGAMLEKHFCMGRVADWSFGKSTGEDCGLCGMPKNEEQDNGCCSDQESFFKVTDEQKAQACIIAPSLSPEYTLPAHPHHKVLTSQVTSGRSTFPSTVAASPGAPRHILISVFRI